MTKHQDKILLDLWREIVFLRAGYRCEICGEENKRLNAHHIFSRRKKSTRYDTTNGILLCFTHHRGGRDSAHESPEWFRKKLIERMGRIPYETLYQKSQRPIKYLDYEEIKRCLEKELEKLTKCSVGF